jgi:hypothetical protein
LDCGGLTPLWIFPSTRLTPSKAPSSRSTPRHPHGLKTPWATAQRGPGNSRKTSFFLFFAPSRLRVRPFSARPPVSRSADVRRLPPQYVRRGIPTEIHIRFHPPGEARQVPKSFPWAHWISLRGLPAIVQLRLIESTTSFWGLPSDPLSVSKLMSQQATDTFDKNYLLWQPIS